MNFAHVSVLLKECIDWLVTDKDGIYVDCTLGGAGHSSEIAKRLSDKGRLIGIDQDDDALTAASERLKDARCKVDIVKSNFKDLTDVLRRLEVEEITGLDAKQVKSNLYVARQTIRERLKQLGYDTDR